MTKLILFYNESKDATLEAYKNGIDKMLEYRCANIQKVLFSDFETSNLKFYKNNKNLLNYANRWLGMKKMKLNCVLILFAYSMPALIQIFLKDHFYQRSVFQYAFALTYSLKIGEFIDGFIGALAPTMREISSFNRLENFIKNGVCDNSNSKKLKIVG